MTMEMLVFVGAIAVVLLICWIGYLALWALVGA
jgi:hypothetical protein